MKPQFNKYEPMKSQIQILAILVSFIIPLSTVFPQSPDNFYFGDIHSHTWYSDGHKDQDTNTYKKPVARAITYGRDNTPNFDFLGVSDHNHNEGGLHMKLGYWRNGIAEADSINQDGVFVGMFGQEWGTISGGGHVLIYGTEKLFGWNPGIYDVYVPKGDYARLFDSVKHYGGFCYLAHPVETDFDGIFTGSYNASWDSVVQGIALKSGPAFSTSTTENDPDNGNTVVRYHDLLKKGYHVAPIANQDNHYTNFGLSNQQRTVVVGSSLTRENILDGLRQRRAYATEDHNLQIGFEVGNNRMGDIFTLTDTVKFRIKIIDPDESESIIKIELRSGVPESGADPIVLASAVSIDSLVYSYVQSVNSTRYYYVYVEEADGNRAWSAPMWITISPPALPGMFSQTTPANGTFDQPVNGTLSWQLSPSATSYDIYLDSNNPPTTLVSANQFGTIYSYNGLINNGVYYWKVVAKNNAGSVVALNAPNSFMTIIGAPTPFSLVNPSDGSKDISVVGTLTWEGSINAIAYDVYLDVNNPPTLLVNANQMGLSYNYSGLTHDATYYWNVVAKNSAGSIVASSVPRSFSTIGPPPSEFSLLSPSNLSEYMQIDGVLLWEASTHAVNYDVYLDVNNPPAILVASNQAETSFNYENLSYNQTYYWKIVAKNFLGSVVANGSPWQFTTEGAIPGLFTFVVPSNNASDQPLSGTLKWTSSLYAEGYDVYLDLNNVPVTLVGSDIADTTFSFFNLLPGSTYHWQIVAKNQFGSREIVDGEWSFITSTKPASVSTLRSNTVTTNSLRIGWDDNANNELGYRVYRSTNAEGLYLQISQDLPTNTTVFNDTGLNVNQQYYYRVVPFNMVGEGNIETLTVWTLADVPGVPSVSNVTYNSLTLTIDSGNNPIITQFVIGLSSDSIDQYIQSTGLLGSVEQWMTFREWGGAGGTVIRDLIPNTSYTISVKARNQAGTETSFGSSVSQATAQFILTMRPTEGWNLLSLPINVLDDRLTSIFPTSSSLAFSYNHGYSFSDSLKSGKGYWIKFNKMEEIKVVGNPRYTDTIDVKEGWNIIGSIAVGIGVNSIFTEPSGIISSPFYRFDGSYVQVDSILPLKGYWVKVNQIGQLILSASGSVNPSNRIRIEPSAELPPPPPEGSKPISGSAPPTTFALEQNFPNPFNPTTTIKFDLPSPSILTLRVYNVLGAEVSTLIEEKPSDAGIHSLEFDGEGLISGIYFYRLIATPLDGSRPFEEMKKMILLR